MTLPPHRSYRDSGAPWLGGVPKHWQLRRLKHNLRLVTGKTDRRENPVALENIEGWSGRLVPTETAFEGEGIGFSKGDILFGKLRPYLAKVFLADRPGEAVGDLLVLRPQSGNAARFLQYQLLNRPLIDVVDGATFGAKMPRIGWDFLGSLVSPSPPEPEQNIIAAFLDRETAKIDALVAQQRCLIGILAEKRRAAMAHAVTHGLDTEAVKTPSGVEWLGDVPKSWKVIRLGALFRESAEPGNDVLPVLSVSIHHGVSEKEFDGEELERKVSRSEDRSKYIRVQPRDLVYNMMRAWQGGFGSVKVEGMVSPAYVVARPTAAIHTEFVEQLLRTPQAIEELRRHSHGVTDFRLRLYWGEFKSIKVALPSEEEQRTIMAFVHKETERFDALSAEAEAGIALLQERRAALISAAVTGKIDVRRLAAGQSDGEVAA